MLLAAISMNNWDCGWLRWYSTTTSRCMQWCWINLMTNYHLSCRQQTAGCGLISEGWKTVILVSTSHF